jgi:hypothetical protein
MHKKYIKRGSARFGPYYYETYRQNGLIKTRYVGKDSSPQKFSAIILSTAILIFFALFLIYSNAVLTGHVISLSKTTIQPNETLQGNFEINLKEGELIPSNSLITVEFDGKKIEKTLNEFILLSGVNLQEKTGNYFSSSSEISGFGPGFGWEGRKTEYPSVSFRLEPEIISIQEENPNQILGTASKGNDYIYDGMANLVSGSVYVSDKQLADDAISLMKENGKTIISTSYFEETYGFGQGYLNDNAHAISLDISKLNLTSETPGTKTLAISLSYNKNAIVSESQSIDVLAWPEIQANCGGATACNCNDNMTSDYNMTSDLTGCTGNGLNIKAAGITLDCQGHFINGTGGGYGIYDTVNYVTIKNCNINNFGQGIRFQSIVRSNVTNCNITNMVDYGLRFWFSGDNIILNCNTSGSHWPMTQSHGNQIINTSLGSVLLETDASGNIFTGNTPFGVTSTDSINNLFRDQLITSYSFGNAKFKVENTNYGLLSYTTAITESGANLSDDININYNLISVNSAKTGLNVSAELILNNISGFRHPIILRNGIICNRTTSPSCYNFTNFSGTVVFNVSSFTNYSIGEGPNTPPTQNTPILNSTYGTNKSDENLTCYPQNLSDLDGDAVYPIFNWYKNGKPSALLNLPFDSNISSNATRVIKDYSGFNNNGTLGNGTDTNKPEWTLGKVGGAYDFDGINDSIVIPDSNSLDIGTGDFSVEAWIYRKTNKSCMIVEKYKWGFPSEGYYFYLNGSKIEGGTMDSSFSTSTSIPENKWFHIVFSYKRASWGIKIYINGTQNTMFNPTYGDLSSNASMYIGKGNAFTGCECNATIDELRIYNYSLSAQEVYQHYIEGLNVLNKSTIVSQELIERETWKCSVTPNDLQPNTDGETKNSTEITILDMTPPSINFTYPTPANGTFTTNRFIPVLIEANDPNYKNYSYYLYNSTGLVSNDKYYKVNKRVSAGGYHTCALLNNGNITCWGRNLAGQSENYTKGDALGVSSGTAFTCALLNNGNVTCWGNNNYDQSNNYTKGDAIDVSTAQFHTCALLNNGNVTCWGANLNGQSTNYTQGDAIGVSAGGTHTCALLKNGNITCWGNNDDNQSLNYTLGDAIGVSAGLYHTCALLNTGNVTCWGAVGDNYGQAANYTLGNAIGVTAGTYHTCALLNNGNITCWGISSGPNYDGQTANYTKGNAIGVSAKRHTCALLNNGNITCWGVNDDGQSENYTKGNVKKQAFYTFQNLDYGPYYINATACDTYGNCNWTETRTIRIQSETNNPSSYLISPSDSSVTGQSSQTFVCNATDDSALSSITLYIWNSTSLVYNPAQSKTGTANSSSFSYTLPRIDNYTWNCLASDSSENFAFAAANYSLNLTNLIVSPGILDMANTVYSLQNNVSSNGTCFEIQADSITLDCQGFMINHNMKLSGGDGIALTASNIVVKNCIINNTNGTAGGSCINIPLSTSKNITIYNNTIKALNCYTAPCRGISSSGSSINIISNQIDTVTGINSFSIYLTSNSTNITGNIINANDGIGLANSYNAINGNNITAGRDALLISSSNNYIIGNNITSISSCGACGAAIKISANNNTFNNNVLTLTHPSNGGGISVSGSNNSFSNDIFYQIGANSILSIEANKVGNIVKNSVFNSTNLSFTGMGIVLTNYNPPADSNNLHNISKYASIGSSSSDSWIMLNISYDAVPSWIDENSLRIYKWNNSDWILANLTSNYSGVDTINNVVYANITNFSTFAVMGELQNLTSCRTLDQANTVYYLQNNVSSNGTCFTISADNITLDCQGYIINFSLNSDGNGIYSNKNYTTIKNCNIEHSNTSVAVTGIGLEGVNGIVYNNSISILLRRYSYGIVLHNSRGSNVSLNKINISSGVYAPESVMGIRLYGDSSNSYISNNYIYAYLTGIDVEAGANNVTIIGNNVIKNNSVQGDHGILVETNNNKIFYNNISQTGVYDVFGISLGGLYNLVSNNTISSGMLSLSNGRNNVTGNKLAGISVQSSNNYFSDNSNIGSWYNSRFNSYNNTVIRLSIDNGNISFLSKDITIQALASGLPSDSNNLYNISKYFSIVNNSADSFIMLNVSYNTTDVPSWVDENSLRIYKWNNSNWIPANASNYGGVDNVSNVVYANITSFSTFAVMGGLNIIPPSINFTYPTTENNANVTKAEINVSIAGQNLSEIKFNWNGTNYTFYNDSLVLMMNFDNRSSLGENATLAADVSKYGNNGTCNLTANQCPIWNSSGRYGGAYQFDGSNDYIQTNSFTSTNPSAVSLWYYTSTVPTVASTFIEKSNPSVTGTFGLYDKGSCTTGTFTLWFKTTAGWQSFCSNGSFQAGRWYFLAAVINGSVVTWYMNGINDTTYDFGNAITATSSPLVLGHSIWNNNFNFAGKLDEVALWNRALSADEIQQQYQSNLQKFNQTQWYFYSSQSNLSAGTYTYSASAKDSEGNENQTELRTVNILTDWCGKTLTQDLALAVNLDCPGQGLTAGADNLIIDCQGHIISHSTPGIASGIHTSNRNNITIKNCTLVNYSIYVGSAGGGSSNNRVTGNNISGYIYVVGNYNNIEYNIAKYLELGYESLGSGGNNITGNNITSAGTGMKLWRFVNSNKIISNTLITSGVGIELQHNQDNTFINNTIITSGNGASGIYQYSWCCYPQYAGRNNFTGNNITTSGSNAHGVFFSHMGPAPTSYDNHDNLLSYNNINTFGQNSHGIYMSRKETWGNTMIGNNITGNFSSGAYGINISNESINNKVILSTIQNYEQGIHVEESAPSFYNNLPSVYTNLIYKNNFINNTVGVWSKYARDLAINGSGNFWNKTSPPYFVAGTDTNSVNVTDSNPLTQKDGSPVIIPSVTCGKTVTVDTAMNVDLNCPTLSGISLEADNITFDGGGHAISYAGISASGRNNLTIKNSKVIYSPIIIVGSNNNNITHNYVLGYIRTRGNYNTIEYNNLSEGIYINEDGLTYGVSGNNVIGNNMSFVVIYRYAQSNNFISNTIRGGGIWMQSSAYNNFINNTIITTGNSATGIYAYYRCCDIGDGGRNNFTGNSITTSGNNSYGMQLSSTAGGPYRENTFNIISYNVINTSGQNSHGILADSPVGVVHDNRFIGNNISTSGNAQGIYFFNSSSNYLENNTLYAGNLSSFEFYSSDGSQNNAAINLYLMSVNISFLSKDVAIKSAIFPPADSNNFHNVSRYLNMTNTAANSWILLNVSYSDNDWQNANVSENSLRIYKHNRTAWISATASSYYGVDTAKNIAYAYITNFSTFGIFGYESPWIDFTPPTLSANAHTNKNSVEVNVSIGEQNLNEFKFSWNGTNTTFYNDSLVLMLNFDNRSALGENATLAVDVSKYSNNGTCSGASCPNWNSSGKYGGDYQFNGGECINTSTNVTTASDDNFTIEAWVNPTSINQNGQFTYIASRGIGLGMSCGLPNNDCPGKTLVGLAEGYVWLNSGYNFSSVNQWYDIVMTRKAGTYYFYVNGAQTPNTFGPGYGDGIPVGNGVYVGCSIGIGIQYYIRKFNGAIDEVRIYNRSVSASEIQQHYLSNLQKYNQSQWYFYANESNLTDATYTYQAFANDIYGNSNQTDLRSVTIDLTYPQINFTAPTPASGASSQIPIPINVSISEQNLNEFKFNWNGTNYTFYNDSLVLMMNFENNSAFGESATFIRDLSKYGNNGTCSGASCPAWTSAGKFGGAYNFDGNDIVSTPLRMSPAEYPSLTIVAWARPYINYADTNPTDTGQIASGDDGGFDRGYGVKRFDGTFTIQRGNGNWDTGIPSDFGIWQHTAVIYTPTQITFCKNGNCVNYGSGGVFGSSSEPLDIGDSAGCGGCNLNGTVDELRVYGRALSVDEIKQQYYSNLQKYNQTDWNFYSNQSKLYTINYTYSASAKDIAGNENQTEIRSITVLNSPPTQTTPKVNSTFGGNYTIENITCYPQGFDDPNYDAVYPVFNWKKNNVPIAVLNMPFDLNISSNATGAIKDYSGYGNNGTLGTGNDSQKPIWTTGKIGGAYQFDGVNDSINCENKTSFNPSAFTYGMWVKLNSMNGPDGYSAMLSRGGDTLSLMIKNNGKLATFVYVGPPIEWVSYDGNGANTLQTGMWYHIACTYNSSEGLRCYVNGNLDGSNNSNTGGLGLFGSMKNIYVGCGNDYMDPPRYLYRYLNGSIDNVQIYNRSLSRQEIYQIYLEGNNSLNKSTIVSQELSDLDNWTCQVTPNDLQLDGQTQQANITISDATLLRTCQGLTIANSYYRLQNNVSSNGTCFEIQANNTVLDCQGYQINYSATSAGNGIYTSYSSKNITIKNCRIIRNPAFGVDGDGIHFDGTSYSNVINNTLALYSGGYAVGIRGIFINSTIANNTIISALYNQGAITLDTGSKFVNVTGNNISSGGFGANGNNITFKDNNVYCMLDGGAVWVSSSDSYVINNNITNYGSAGGVRTLVIDGTNNKITGNNITKTHPNSGSGIAVFGTGHNFSNNLVTTEGGIGIYITSTTSNDIFVNNTVYSNQPSTPEFYSESGAENITIIDLHLISANIGFASSKAVWIKAKNSGLPADSNNLYNISKYLDITNNSANSFILLNVSYSHSDITRVNESTLRIYKYNNSDWIPANASSYSGVNTTSNVVYANITSFSTFAVMGQDTNAPVVSLTSPADGAVDTDKNITFRCGATNIGLVNLTVYVWNSTSLYNSSTSAVTGASNQSEFNMTLPQGGYKWNCLASDISGNSGFAAQNRTVASIAGCGFNITQNTILEDDLVCSGNGLGIGASSIFLDCSGHSINGSGIGMGVYSNKNYAAIRNCNVNNFSNAFYIWASSNNVTNCNSTGGGNEAIYIWFSGNHIFTNCNISKGVYAAFSNNNNFINSSIGGSAFFDASSSGTRFINSILNSVHLEPLSHGTFFENNTFASGTLTILSSNSITLKNQIIPSYNFNNVGFTIEDTNEGKLEYTSSVTQSGSNLSDDIKINYNLVTVNSSQTGLNKSANLYFYNTSALNLINRHPYRNGVQCPVQICREIQDADTYIFNVTGFTIYSVGEFDVTLPTVSLVSPQNNFITNVANQTLRCNASDDVSLDNLTVYIWNSTNDLLYANTTDISGTFNDTIWNYTLPYDDNYKWNCLVSDSAGHSVLGDSNWNLQYNTSLVSSCGNLASSKSYYLISNVSSNDTCFDIQANNITLDCQGNIINYSATTVGYGINVNSYDDFTIKNCIIKQTNSTFNSAHGIKIQNSNKGAVLNSILTTTGMSSTGIYSNTVNLLNITKNNITTGYGGDGILIYGDNCSIIYNNISASGSNGIKLNSKSHNIKYNQIRAWGASVRGIYVSSGNYVVIAGNNIIAGGGQYPAGINIDSSSSNINITDNSIWSTNYGNVGLGISNSNNNSIRNNSIISVDNLGMQLTSSSNNEIINNTITAGNFDFYSSGNSRNNTVLNLYTQSANVSFLSLDVAVDAKTSSLPADSNNIYNISKYLSITNNSANSFILLNVSYSHSDVPLSINENNLKMYKHNGTDWIFANTTSSLNGVDTINNIVYANITSFSVFAPMGYDNLAPNVSLISPANASVLTQALQTFRCNASEDRALKNITLFIWNSTNNLINTSTTTASGTFQQANFVYKIPYNGNFKWNCLAYDYAGNYNFSKEGNYTLTLNATYINSCQDLDITNQVYEMQNNVSSSGTCFNILANNVTLECTGYKINGTAAGTGISAVGYNYTTIKNCIIENFWNGIVFGSAINGTISNDSIISIGDGIDFESSSNNQILNSKINSTANRGIYFNYAFYTTIDNCNVTAADCGVYMGNSKYNSIMNTFSKGGAAGICFKSYSAQDNVINCTLMGGSGIIVEQGGGANFDGNFTINNTYISGSSWGIRFYSGASHSRIINSRAEASSQAGINLQYSNDVIIENCTVNSNGTYGIHTTYGSHHNNLTNVIINSTRVDFYSESGSYNIILTNITFNSSSYPTKASLTYSGNISIYSANAVADSFNMFNISKYLNITNQSAASVQLKIHYENSNIPPRASESTLNMYRSNASGWNAVPGSYVNITGKFVYANITSFSIFAPFANDISAPVITIINPAQNSQLPGGTTQTIINISTNEAAECRYYNASNSTFDFSDGIEFNSTNSTYHSFIMTELSNGQSYSLYYKCNDTIGNINPTSIEHNFSVAIGGGGGPPPCTPSWSCGGWSACVNGKHTRTCSDGCGSSYADEQNCVVCTENWQCSSWTSCVNNQQTRTCNDANNCGTTINRPPLSQYCCSENWQCSGWSSCVNGQQTRTCSDANNCGTTVYKPSLSQACCNENWICSDWTVCINSNRTRTCNDANNCGTTAYKPIEKQSCLVPQCSDGTMYNICSINQPKFCSNGNLIDKCSQCECPDSKMNCLGDGTCAYECSDDSDCIAKLGKGYECKNNKCWLEESECNVDSDCGAGKYCLNGECKVLQKVETQIPTEAPAPVLDKKCVPKWNCGKVSECRLEYSIVSLIEFEPGQILEGKAERTCIDESKCMPPRVESIKCSKTLDIKIEREMYCDEPYINIYNMNGTLIATLREREANALDISLGTEYGLVRPPCVKKAISGELLAPVPTGLANISKTSLAISFITLLLLITTEIVILSRKPEEEMILSPAPPREPEFPSITIRKVPKTILERAKENMVKEYDSKLVEIERELSSIKKSVYEAREKELLQEKLRLSKIRAESKKIEMRGEKKAGKPDLRKFESELADLRKEMHHVRHVKREKPAEEKINLDRIKEELRKKFGARVEKEIPKSREEARLEKELGEVKEKISQISQKKEISRKVDIESVKNEIRKEIEEVGKINKEIPSLKSREIEMKFEKELSEVRRKIDALKRMKS